MKRLVLLLSLVAATLVGFAQTTEKYTEDDAMQFYRTIQGDYTGKINDTTSITLHFTPIWEHEGNRFRWLYMEAVNNESQQVVEQKIIEIKPISSVSFKVLVHDLSQPQRFVGKWGNRNFFDGFNTGILKRNSRFVFLKTKDFDYQTSWNGRKGLKCFPSGDRLHFKFSQEDERFYIKRLPKHTSNLIGITFFKALTD